MRASWAASKKAKKLSAENSVALLLIIVQVSNDKTPGSKGRASKNAQELSGRAMDNPERKILLASRTFKRKLKSLVTMMGDLDHERFCL